MTAAVTRELRDAGVPRRQHPPRVVRVLSRKGIPMRRVILAIVTTAVGLVLLLSLQDAHAVRRAGHLPRPRRSAARPRAAPRAAAPPPRRAGGPPPAAAHPGEQHAPRAGAAKTVTGAAGRRSTARSRCRITVTGGKVTAVAAVEYPEDNPARPADQRLRHPAAQPGGPGRRQREDRHGLRRDLHLGRLRRLAAERPGQGRPLHERGVRRTSDAGCRRYRFQRFRTGPAYFPAVSRARRRGGRRR